MAFQQSQMAIQKGASKSAPKMLFPLDLVEGVLAKTRTELFKALLDLLINATLDADLRAIVEVTSFGALQPHIFTVHLFGQG